VAYGLKRQVGRHLLLIDWVSADAQHLFNADRLPAGRLSIGSGRTKEPGTISADEIPSRRHDDRRLAEMISDIRMLLARKEQAVGVSLADLFHSMMSRERTAGQCRRFGDRAASTGRQVIVQAVEDYAQRSVNPDQSAHLAPFRYPQ